MKKLNYLTCILTIFSAWSCNYHPDCCVLPQPSAVVTAQRNGISWADRFASGSVSSSDTLSISAVSATIPTPGTINKVDTLNFKIDYINPGTYALKGNDAFYGMFNNGTLTGYKIDNTYNNIIVITGYQRLSNPYSTVPDQVRITGTFSIVFLDPKSPSGIKFRNGSFYVLVPYL